MSNSTLLRQTRAHTVINGTSKWQEKEIIKALKIAEDKINKKFPFLQLDFQKKLKLKDIVEKLRHNFPDVDFCYKFETSFITPDGGFLSIIGKDGNRYPIIISEVKNQGTNDKRAKEGLKKQAKGNAIERLGKNVIGLRCHMLSESIFPFVCFGYGCDFADDSSILDRVITVGMFGKLNEIYLHNQGVFNRGSFFFRCDHWSVDEMAKTLYDIGEKSIYYYFSKYGQSMFDINQ
ncbi:MAG: hypothetical protein IJ866_01640 [Alphaproteobacteria bacterium]|nr:hypothetical protein [Alphaproteobacteria bacterium]